MAALALAGAPSAAASSGGGSMPGGATSAGGATEPSAGGATQPSAGACTSTPTAASGGAGMGATSGPSWQSSQPAALPCPRPTVAGTKAQIIDGLAYAPADAPIQVQDTIWAGDRIRFKPYLYGGGHGRWNDVGYDCSGSVSYVLHAAGLLKTSMDSSEFMTWDRRGVGQWITVYTNPAHAFIEIAGIRFDTSAEGDGGGWVQIPAGTGPRWRPLITSTTGFDARHPAGL